MEKITLSDPSYLVPVIKKESGFTCNSLFARTIADKFLDIKESMYMRAKKNAIKKFGNNPTNTVIESELVLQKQKAAQILFNGLSAVRAMGGTTDDSDKLYLVPRDGCLTVVSNIELFRRCAARKGYIISTDLVAIPKNDSNNIYAKEIVINGEFRQQIIDESQNRDREITSARLKSDYFYGYLIRATVKAKNGRLIVEKTRIISNAEVMSARSKAWGLEDTSSVWNVWTHDMVEKVCFRKVFKTIVEMLPELTESFYQFGKIDEMDNTSEQDFNTTPVESEPIQLTADPEAEFNARVSELVEEYVENPKLAMNHAEEIENTLKQNWTASDIKSKYAVHIEALSKSTNDAILAVVNAVRDLITTNE